MAIPTRWKDLGFSAVIGALLLVLLLHGLDILAPHSDPQVFAQSESDAVLQSHGPDRTPDGEPENTIHLPLIARCWPPAPSPFALQIAALHEISGEFSGTLVTRLAESGAAWARVRVDWPIIEGDAPGDYSWDYHDRNLTQVVSAGIKLIGTIAGTPAWAGYNNALDPNATWEAGDPCAPIDPDMLDEFRRTLTLIVDRYGQPPWNIRHWELYNEPDITEPEYGQSCYGFYGEMYVDMLQVAYAAIKAANPAATVLMGAVAYDKFVEYGGDNKFNRYFSDDVMALGGADYMDAFGFHYFPDFHAEWDLQWPPDGNWPVCGDDMKDPDGIPYEAWGVDLVAKSKHFLNRMEVCQGVKKPLWITEMAEHGEFSDPAGLAKQARYVIQGYARGLAAGAVNITWFALVEPAYDEYDQGLLFRGTLSPKPAYVAYQTMASELSGFEYAATRDAPGPDKQGMEAYIFRYCGREKTVAWLHDPGEAGGSGTLTFHAAELRVVDRFGNPTLISDGDPEDLDREQNEEITIEITIEPVFVSAN